MTSLRERALGSNPKAVAEAEAQRQKEMAESNKARARERELSRWFDSQFGSKKPMRVFTATVGEATEDIQTGTRLSDGQDYTMESLVFPLTDVSVEDGTEANEIRIRVPEAGKSWSQHSEGAIMVRESNGLLANVLDLEGKRLRFEGDWMPTFLDKKQFWQGTYFYRVSLEGEATAAAPVTIDPSALSAFVEAALAHEKVGSERKNWKTANLLRCYQQSGIEDKALESAIINSDFVGQLIEQGVLVETEDGLAAVTPDLPFE